MSSSPLVSCIMPTRGRPRFVTEAVVSFQMQTWPFCELVIVDDRDARSFPLPLQNENIQYHLLETRLSVGAKRNLAVSRARGEIIAHWDDDDWSAPGRIQDQLERLLDSGAQVTGYNTMRFRNGSRQWHYEGAPDYALGTSLMYRREFWRRHPFEDVNVSEDNALVAAARREGVLVAMDARDLLIASIHSENTSPRELTRLPFREIAWA